MPQPVPPMWKTGMATSDTSPSPQRFHSTSDCFCRMRGFSIARCDSIAPLGLPVVPEV